MDENISELKHLEMVQTKIKQSIDELNAILSTKQQEIVNMKKYFWETCNEFDEFGYEEYTNRQMIQSELDSAETRLHRRQLLERMWESPYFARIDFKCPEDKESGQYYIGVASFLPKKAHMPLVFDWRAPISGLYYDFDKGPAAYESPQGTIEGEITRKLQYKITHGKMEYFFENDVKIDDEILMRELGSNSSTRLKNIVATIQREQNAIIRNETDRILVVQGAAGSGKTSIALHRIAYLMYHKRKELNSSNVMILSPNNLFSDYISHILPELGEESVVEMSFDDFAVRELRGITRFESKNSQLEYILKNDGKSAFINKKHATIKHKQSREFMQEIYGFTLELEDSLVDWEDLECYKIQRTQEQMEDLFYNKFGDIPLLKRLETVVQYIIDEEETLTGKDMDIIRAQVLTDKVVKMYRTRDIKALYREFLVGNDEDFDEVDDGIVPYEDVYPIIYLKYLLLGASEHRSIKHLVVDEMQDYSLIQYSILDLMISCPMTILGDKSQVIDDEYTDMGELLHEVYGHNLRYVNINKSYRSTYEIGTFSGRIIDASDIDYFDRHGREPGIISCSDEDSMMEAIYDKLKTQSEYTTTAVICRTQREAETVQAELTRRGMDSTLITSDSKSFNSGIMVTSFYMAKGLEFDAVHVPYVSAGNYKTKLDRQALYIACTRALHELDCYYVGECTSFIK